MAKLLVLTGGSKGIGLATAERFLAAGYEVVNLSRSAIALQQAQQLSVDLSALDWPEKVAAELQTKAQTASQIVLLHNGAVLEKDSVQTVLAHDLQRVLQVNLIAASQLNQLLLPHMLDGSSILYVGSTLSEQAVAGSCSYVVSKHAQLGLMRATCQDLMGSGVHTAAICPGFTDTEMLRAHLGDNQELLMAIAGQNAFGRLVQPSEIAESLWFAAQTPAINGAIIHANLGQKQS